MRLSLAHNMFGVNPRLNNLYAEKKSSAIWFIQTTRWQLSLLPVLNMLQYTLKPIYTMNTWFPERQQQIQNCLVTLQQGGNKNIPQMTWRWISSGFPSLSTTSESEGSGVMLNYGRLSKLQLARLLSEIGVWLWLGVQFPAVQPRKASLYTLGQIASRRGQ